MNHIKKGNFHSRRVPLLMCFLLLQPNKQIGDQFRDNKKQNIKYEQMEIVDSFIHMEKVQTNQNRF